MTLRGWDCQNCGTENGPNAVCTGCGYRGGQPLGRPRKIPVADGPEQFPVPPEKRRPAPGGGWIPAVDIYDRAERILEENRGVADAAAEAGISPEDAALELAVAEEAMEDG
jgi:hypothetical protein